MIREETTCIEALQAFEKWCLLKGRSGTCRDFRNWRGNNRSVPSLSSIIGTFSSWNNARRSASEHPGNLTFNPHGRHRPKIWTLEVCLEAIRRYEWTCEESGKTASRDGYQEWQKNHADAPSIFPIERFGRWNDMRVRAAVDPSKVKVNFPSRHSSSRRLDL